MKPSFARPSNGVFAGERLDQEPSAPRFVARVILVGLRAYKLLVSQYFAGACRFLPSCADYSRDAVLTHGAAYGGWLTLRRLARCHPLCAGGHDPVPSRRKNGESATPDGCEHPAPRLGGASLR